MTHPLSEIYSLLKPISCMMCGQCCVLPQCTFVEFVFLMNEMQSLVSFETRQAFLTQKLQPSKQFQGNFDCIFQKNQQCQIHPARTLMCRLHGDPILTKIGQSENCKKVDREETLSEFDLSQIGTQLDHLNRVYYEIDAMPFLLDSLNIACWLELYYSDLSPLPFIKNIQIHLKTLLHPDYQHHIYTPVTQILDKFITVDKAYYCLENGDVPKAEGFYWKLIEQYPDSIGYYTDKAFILLEQLYKNLNRSDKLNFLALQKKRIFT